MIVEERMRTFINSLDTGNTPFLDELECSALSEGVPIIRKEMQSFIKTLLALKKPNILIPLPAASSRGDQLLNAASFEAQGYSIVLNEDDITTNLLVDKVHELYFNRQNYVDAMSKSHQMDAVKTIMELINEAADKKTN